MAVRSLTLASKRLWTGGLKMALIVDGKLTIPLYHGTSDLHELVAICQSNLPNQEEWLVRMDDAEPISRQAGTAGGFNFRHGSVYLTPSSNTAAKYAASSEYGSEALGCFMMLWNRLRESLVELPKDVADGARPILDFARRPNAPVVIRLDGVPVHALASENGGDPADTLERIEQFLQDKLFLVMCGQSNFELLEPVSVRETDVFRVVEHWDSAEKEPLLTPYSPTGAPVATKA